MNKIEAYYKTDEARHSEVSIAVKKIAVKMGLHRDLRLDSLPHAAPTLPRRSPASKTSPRSRQRKDDRTALYDGRSYSPEKIRSSVMAARHGTVAYSVATLDRQRGKVADFKSQAFFTQHYLGRQATGSPGARRTEKPMTHWSAAWQNHRRSSPKRTRSSTPAPAKSLDDDGPRGYSCGIYGRSKRESAGHQSGAHHG